MILFNKCLVPVIIVSVYITPNLNPGNYKVYSFLTTCCRSVCLYITDYCRNVECRNGATCVNGETEYHCVCERGFTGRLCHVTSPTEIRDLIRVGM